MIRAQFPRQVVEIVNAESKHCWYCYNFNKRVYALVNRVPEC